MTPVEAHADPQPPPEPPPDPFQFDVDLLITPPVDPLTSNTSPPPISVDLNYETGTPTSATDIAPLTYIPDSVTHVVCTPRVCGLHGDANSSIRICRVHSQPDQMVDACSNVCVTSDLGSLLDVIDIDLISILVAIKDSPLSFDDCITKRGVLPLSLSEGTTSFQPCYYCANMVETIISRRQYLHPATSSSVGDRKAFATPPSLAAFASPATMASRQCTSRYTNVVFSWRQEGFRNPTIPGSLCFTSHDGLTSMHFPLRYHDGLY